METLKINGQEKEFPQGQLPSTLTELLKTLNVDAATVVAEINGDIIPREKFEQTELNKDQSIELVRFVGGG